MLIRRTININVMNSKFLFNSEFYLQQREVISNYQYVYHMGTSKRVWKDGKHFKIALIIFILTVFLQELEAVIEPLGAHVTENGGVGRKQGPGDSVEIPTGQLHASVGQYNMLKVGRVVRRTNVALPGKRRHCDGFIVQDWQIVAQASIHVSLQYRTV